MKEDYNTNYLINNCLKIEKYKRNFVNCTLYQKVYVLSFKSILLY